MAAPATIPATDGGDPSPKNSNNSSRTTEEERDINKNQIFNPTAEETLIPAAKRPRGRPPGSKNKLKAASYVSVDPNDAFRSHIMEVAPGADVASSLFAYARTRHCCVAVLHATGSVAGLSFRHAAPFKGRFDIVSLRGTFFPDSSGPTGLTLFVASGPAGNVIGGVVNGPLIAASPVMITAATFSITTIERLPLEAAIEERQERGSGSDNSDPGHGKGLIEESGSGYNPNPNPNPGFMNMGAVMTNWRPDNLPYGWQQQQQQQQNSGRRNYY